MAVLQKWKNQQHITWHQYISIQLNIKHIINSSAQPIEWLQWYGRSALGTQKAWIFWAKLHMPNIMCLQSLLITKSKLRISRTPILVTQPDWCSWLGSFGPKLTISKPDASLEEVKVPNFCNILWSVTFRTIAKWTKSSLWWIWLKKCQSGQWWAYAWCSSWAAPVAVGGIKKRKKIGTRVHAAWRKMPRARLSKFSEEMCRTDASEPPAKELRVDPKLFTDMKRAKSVPSIPGGHSWPDSTKKGINLHKYKMAYWIRKESHKTRAYNYVQSSTKLPR